MSPKDTANKIINFSGKQSAYMLVFTVASLDDSEYPYKFAEVEGDKEFWLKVLSVINRS